MGDLPCFKKAGRLVWPEYSEPGGQVAHCYHHSQAESFFPVSSGLGQGPQVTEEPLAPSSVPDHSIGLLGKCWEPESVCGTG